MIDKKYHVIFIFLLLSMTILPAQNVRSNRVFINTSEFREFRRILVHMPYSENNEYIASPKILFQDGQRFLISLDIGDTNLYIGSRQISGKGDHPVELSLSFNNSTQLRINGLCDNYYQLNSYYSFSNHQYVFDIFWKKPVETAFSEKGMSGDYPPDDQLKMVDIRQSRPNSDKMLVPQKFVLADERLIIAIFLSAGFLILVSMVVFWILKMKKQNKLANAKPPKNQKKSATEKPKVKSKDEQIRDLAKEKGVSYDEAAILLNMAREDSVDE